MSYSAGATPQFIHRYLPPAPGNERTLLMLHGTGGDETSLVGLGQAIAPGAGILSPRGKVLEGTMPRFFRRHREGVLDLADLEFRAADLAAFVDAASAQYGFDPAKVVAIGYSNGANIATELLFRHPGVLAGAAILHGMLPYEPAQLPGLSGKPLLLTGGRRDPLVAAAQTERLASLFQEAGGGVTLHWHPGGHELAQSELTAMQQWYRDSFPG